MDSLEEIISKLREHVPFLEMKDYNEMLLTDKEAKEFFKNNLIKFVKKSFSTYQDINWKFSSDRDKNVALSVESSIIIDIVHELMNME